MGRRLGRSRGRAVIESELFEEAEAFFESLMEGEAGAESGEEFFADLMGQRPRRPTAANAGKRVPVSVESQPPRARRAPRRRRRRQKLAESTPAPRRVSASALIRWLQEALSRAGVGPVAVDGIVGSQTRGALRRFARAKGLPADGRRLGPVLRRLARATASVPPGVFAGPMPTSNGRAPDLSVPCTEPPQILDRFVFGRAEPTTEHRPRIDALASTIVASLTQPEPIHSVFLDGHTDSVGSREQNERLGQRRAEAVQDALAAAIERAQAGASARVGLWSTTSGEARPLAPNTSQERRARNRRVELRLCRAWRGGGGGGGDGTAGVFIARPPNTGESPGIAPSLIPGEQVPDHTVEVGSTLTLIANGTPTPVGNPGYTWTSADPAIATVVSQVGSQQHPNEATVTGVAAGQTTITVRYRSSVGGTATATSTVEVTAPITRYGCHELRDGDRDRDPTDGNRPRWGGQAGAAASVCPGAGAAPPAVPRHVRDLQSDLRTLGFSIVGAPSGDFDRATRWAVREFQIYAKMETVARVRPGAAANLRRGAHEVAAELGYDATSQQSEYVASLEAVANAARYRGPVSGVVNADTRAALDHWLANNWRCPVVIEAWSMRGGARHRPAAINIWAHDSHNSSAPRMFARDFTGYYTLPAGRNAGDMHVIGDFVTYLTWSGPRSVPPRHTWAEAEIFPQGLVGNAAPAGATLSTFRVVRAVADVECIGFFDSVNCYDNAFVSIGPAHWTLGIVDAAGAFSEGELCGYLAYLRNVDAAAFTEAIEFFGVRIDEDWRSAAGADDGADLFSAGQRKYTGWVAMQQENRGFVRLAQTEDEGNYFKTWHWHYRFVMAGRTIDGYRRRMWDMARIRLRDVAAVPWGAGVANVAVPGGADRAATIGDVFTSERARAMLQRWHVRSPAHVVNAGAPGGRLRNVLARAQAAAAALDWTTDPSTWTDDHEQALVDAIVPAAAPGVRGSLETVRDWPTWLGGANPRGFALAAPVAAALSADRNSFDFDTAGLPPAPP